MGFLEPALSELADEAETLRGNVEGLRALSASLDTFNEAFSSWLYVMNMNALTVDWPEVCVFYFIRIVRYNSRACNRRQRKHPLLLHSGGPVRPPIFLYSCVSIPPTKRQCTEEDARAAPPPQAQTSASAKSDETANATTLGGNTMCADESLVGETSKSAIGKVKKKGKAKLTPKERKERTVRLFLLSHNSR